MKWGLRLITFLILSYTSIAIADDDCDEVCQAARNAQDPLADVRAIITDNTLTYKETRAETVHNYQIQPVYSIGLEGGRNLVLRGILPILGVPGPSGHSYGFSDTIVQAFYVPKTDGGIKFGYGPQISLPTRESDTFAGPGWGIGGAAVMFGFSGNISYGAIAGHHFGEDDFSQTTIQPIFFYNMDFLGGSYVGYNNSIIYDWKSDELTLPLGLTFGKTFLTASGLAVELSLGAYTLLDHPNGSGDLQGKWGLSFFFP